jgi:uncharacterized OB-fold protein
MAALRAPHEVAYSYRRSTGGAVRVFLAGLAAKEIWASRSADGRVELPPLDWDPHTGAAVEGFVRLGEQGIVRSWAWVSSPEADSPLEEPFALALVQIDGADTALLHLVDAGAEASMSTGMIVHADWRAERTGSILDIRAFVPGPADGRPPASSSDPADPGQVGPEEAGPVEVEVVTNLTIPYTYEPGLTLSAFLQGLGDRRIEGGRCPSCAGVYVPPRPGCPECRTGPMEPVALPDRGSVTAYTVVHIPFPGLTMELPFVCAWIRLDGADVPFAHLLGEVGPEDVRVGQRVEAVWVADADLAPTWESVRYFRPAGADEAGPSEESPCRG